MYIVTLNNSQPISVNAHDPRVAEQAINVTRDNCKIGKAKDLAARATNYSKTFGRENVTFYPVAVTDAYQQIERAVLRELDDYRMRGRTGRKNEWLHTITPAEALKTLKRTLENSETEYRLLLSDLGDGDKPG